MSSIDAPTIYRLDEARSAPDGTLEVPISVWEGGRHAILHIRHEPDDPDYDFWRWVAKPWRNSGLSSPVDDEKLAELRARYKRHTRKP